MLSRRPSGQPAAPDGLRLYAVGDIHGCLGPLDRLMAKIARDAADAPCRRGIVFLGDYIDRGTDSKGVIDRLLDPPDGFETHHVRGNHDQALLDFLADPSTYSQWRDFGGEETIASYGVVEPRPTGDRGFVALRDEFRAHLPAEHLDFFRNLPLSVRFGDYFFAHAGVRPGIALADQRADDLLWIRDEFLTSNTDFGAVVVHGHTPSERPSLRMNRIGVDTGCYATGKLSAAVLEGRDCRFLTS